MKASAVEARLEEEAEDAGMDAEVGPLELKRWLQVGPSLWALPCRVLHAEERPVPTLHLSLLWEHHLLLLALA